MNKRFHIKINKKDIANYVLLVGDPSRLDIIAGFLNSSQELFYKREFRVIKGNYEGVRLMAVSTGIGAPSTAIAVEELIKYGARTFIRVGTCGGAWNKKIKMGSLVIPTACVREDGASREYINNLDFPSVADYQVVSALVEAAEVQRVNYYVGLNRTHDAFYGSLNSKLGWQEIFRNLGIKESPILSSDMETSILFFLASLRNVKAGAILAVNSDPELLIGKAIDIPVIESDPKVSKKVIKESVKIALGSIIILNNKKV